MSRISCSPVSIGAGPPSCLAHGLPPLPVLVMGAHRVAVQAFICQCCQVERTPCEGAEPCFGTVLLPSAAGLPRPVLLQLWDNPHAGWCRQWRMFACHCPCYSDFGFPIAPSGKLTPDVELLGRVDLAALVFDTADPSTLEHIHECCSAVCAATGRAPIQSVMVGLCTQDPGRRRTSRAQGEEAARALGIPYVEADVETGDGVLQALTVLATGVCYGAARCSDGSDDCATLRCAPSQLDCQLPCRLAPMMAPPVPARMLVCSRWKWSAIVPPTALACCWPKGE